MKASETNGTGTRAEELAKLVSEALALREEGRADWLEAACKDRPADLERVRAAVKRADELPGLMNRSVEQDVLPGRTLAGRFRILERLGAGAMGVVYLAQDLELGRKVACKVVHHGLMAPEVALQRFEREAHAMAAVQHPAVVTIFDRGRTSGDQVYIVMERIDGPSLSRFLDEAKRRAKDSPGDGAAWIEPSLGVALRGESSYLRTVVRWVAELAAGLEAVHAAGVLHRDIKPSNVLVRADGRPVLLDFGVALLEDQNTATRSPTSLGTPAYMPPEALERKARRTPASDVYSLGATLYHLLTLHAPYEGTPTQILAQLATREPRPAVQLRPGLPRDLQAILDKGMHRNPARRYATAAEFGADLRAFLEFRPISARPVSAVERLWRRLRRSRAAQGALAVLAVLAVAFGAQKLHARYLDSRRAAHAELARHFPPNFSVVGKANRVYRFEADRASLAALLDRAARIAVEPLPTLLLRASFRQDHGDTLGAAEDMARVAEFVDSPFARELAARYAAADPRVRGILALDLTQLPDAKSALDRYLLGYHRLREAREDEALALLGEADVRAIPHAEELYLAFAGFPDAGDPERERVALQRYTDLIRLVERLGAPTATTAQVAGRLLNVQGRFAEASRETLKGIALAPRSHVLRINASYAALALGRIDEARDHLQVAVELRPNYAHLHESLVWIEIAARRFDVAATLVRDAAPGLNPEDSTWLDYWSGVVASYAALDARAAGDDEACTRLVETALTHFEAVPARVNDKDGYVIDTAARIALALGDDQPSELIEALADSVSEVPENWWRHQILLRHLPSTLDASATSAVKRALESLDPRRANPSSR